MRLKFPAAAVVVLMMGLAIPQARAQSDETLLPEQSAAKARTILRQAITALGGPAYLNVRDSDCEGQVSQFGHSGDLMGYAPFHDLWLLPDKHRTEYITKSQNNVIGFLLGIEGPGAVHGGSIVIVFNGDQGWILDKGGVSEERDEDIKNFGEQVKSSMNNVLRSRLDEPGMELRYAGPDLVDLKEADWVEISDSDHRSFRMAIGKNSHLPMRWVVTTRDPETREHSEAVTSYGQFVVFDGVQTPIRIGRTENGREVSQIVYQSCKYGTNLSPELFSRASLETQFAKSGKKGSKDTK